MSKERNFGGWSLDKEIYDWVLENIPKGSTILELGSGRSTQEFCKYYKMYSVEHSKKWLNKSDSIYIYAPIREYSGYRWYDIDALKVNLPTEYSLLIVDGPPGTIGRMGYIYNYNLFRDDIPIIVDDTSRPEENSISKALQEQYRKNKTFSYTRGIKSATILK